MITFLKESSLAYKILAICWSLLSQAIAQTDFNIAQPKNRHSLGPVGLVVLNPAHPHGAQMQQMLRTAFLKDVYVYAPVDNDVEENYLQPMDRYNNIGTTSEAWNICTYIGDDYLERMLKDRKGSVAIIASNNLTKAEYMLKTAEAGFDIIADKPMALTRSDFIKLETAFAVAQKNNQFISDLPAMSMRYQVTCQLQQHLVNIPEIFGHLEVGSPENPAIVQENKHHYDKGIKRPVWFFDVRQQGNGVTDVTTHLIDLVLWTCFSEQSVQYQAAIKNISANLWPVTITPAQFKKVTGMDAYPNFLNGYLNDGSLDVFSNGEINCMIKGVHARFAATWAFKAPKGQSDTHYSMLRGSRAILEIKAGHPTDLHVTPVDGVDAAAFGRVLYEHIERLKKDYPFIVLHQEDNSWRITSTKRSIERTEIFVAPSQWEREAMLAKYYLTTQADLVASTELRRR